jgi:hypothetical protein
MGDGQVWQDASGTVRWPPLQNAENSLGEEWQAMAWQSTI